MKIEINVNLGVTPALERLLAALAGAGAPQPPKGGAKGLLFAAEEARAEAEAPQPPKGGAKGAAEEARAEARTQDQAAREVAAPAEAAAPAEEPAYPSDEEMRAMMDVTVGELTGDNDWRNSNDEVTVKLKKQCSKVFKEIAAHFGAPKPTQLQGQKRHDFLNQLPKVTKTVKADGSVELNWLPF